MGTQLKLPAQWAWIESRRDPIERLDALRHDVTETKARIREALDELAERHGIRPSDIAYAMEGYADDLLSDAIYNVERELEQEIEAEDPV